LSLAEDGSRVDLHGSIENDFVAFDGKYSSYRGIGQIATFGIVGVLRHGVFHSSDSPGKSILAQTPLLARRTLVGMDDWQRLVDTAEARLVAHSCDYLVAHKPR